MDGFALQSTRIKASYPATFAFLADPARLPDWTNAFKSVKDGRARMQTPNGACEVGLRVEAAPAQGTVDWYMTFPDGTVEKAYSRVTDLGDGTCAYAFVLTPPRAPMEQLEGVLEVQAKTLSQELSHLKRILEAR